MAKNYIIVGSGFRGFCDALELSKNPKNNVHIIESSKYFGGITNSIFTKGFFVDKGVHHFDSIPQELSNTIDEIMDGKTSDIGFNSLSAFNGAITKDYGLPDLSSLDSKTKNKIKNELLDIARNKNDKESNPPELSNYILNRFGNTAGKIFNNIFNRVYSINPKYVSSTSISVTSLHRLKFLSDKEMMELKKDPILDKILAARRKSMGKLNDLVSIYPQNGKAMRGWCDQSYNWLTTKGVKISLGEKINSIKTSSLGVEVITDSEKFKADKLIWANEEISSLSNVLSIKSKIKDYQYGTPMIFVVLITQDEKINDFTYLQNFSLNNYTYRTSAAGPISRQKNKDGLSFITSECPAKMNSNFWNNPELFIRDIWNECIYLGAVKDDAQLIDYQAIRIPSTFKPKLVGYKEHFDDLIHQIKKKTDRIYIHNVDSFFRREIYLESLGLAEQLD